MKLLITLQAEMLKTKRTASLYFTLVIAALIPAIFLLNVLTGGSDLAAVSRDPLNSIFVLCAERTSFAFFPVFVILVCTLLPQIEYRNHTWKQVFASPQTKMNVFVAKFLTVNGLLLIFLLAHLFFTFAVIVVTHFYHPQVNLLHQPLDMAQLAVRTFHTYVLMLAMCAFQFWLGLRFRNFILPTAVGLVLWITGMVLVFEESSLVAFFPYCFQIFPFASNLQPKLLPVVWTSIGYALLFLTIGFLDFRKGSVAA